MAYKVRSSQRDITENTTINPSNFGGWMVVNTGTTGKVYVNGFALDVGDGLDLTKLDPSVIWDTPISIVLDPSAKARIMQLRYSEVKVEKKEIKNLPVMEERR